MTISYNSPYFKKTVAYNYRGHDLKFDVSQSSFSSQDIDTGTKHLLKTLSDQKFDNYNKVLDLGCGYGPIGISLKSFCPTSEVHLVDRDALALEYSRQNETQNDLQNLKIYGSLSYDNISDKDFDLIVSNIPAKIGEAVLSHILLDGRFYLRPNGTMAVVVIDAIGDFVTKVLETNKDVNILFYKRWPGHLVFHYKFSQNILQAVPGNNTYARGQKIVPFENSKILIETAYGLPEFDTLSYETEMFLDKIRTFKNRQIVKAIIFNPGQGFIPVALSSISKTSQIVLADRDLLSLRISRKNLLSNGHEENKVYLFHEVGLPKIDSPDLIMGVLDEKDDPKVHLMFLKQAAEILTLNGIAVLASGSTPITRLETSIQKEKLFEVVERRKSKGKSLLVLKKFSK